MSPWTAIFKEKTQVVYGVVLQVVIFKQYVNTCIQLNNRHLLYNGSYTCLLKKIVLPFIKKTERKFEQEKMLNFTQFCNF